jgi:hypothetical protein
VRSPSTKLLVQRQGLNPEPPDLQSHD